MTPALARPTLGPATVPVLAIRRAVAREARHQLARPDIRPHKEMFMPKLDAIAGSESTLTVPFGPDRLSVSYRPAAVTAALIEQLASVDQDAPIGDAVLRPLSQLLVSWDLTTNDGEPIPTTVDGLRRVPLTILTRVAEAVAGAISTPITRARRDAAIPSRRN